MAVKTSDFPQPPVLLRRPLPPKVDLSEKNPHSQTANSKNLASKRQQLRTKKRFALHSKENFCANPVDIARQAGSLALLPSCKPRGPDPLPARQPKRLKDIPYEVPVDRRFLPSIPEFTLEHFVRESDASRTGNEQAGRQFIGRSDDNWFMKRINDISRQQELYQQVIDGRY